MYDYMKALHARFCREPELQKVRAEARTHFERPVDRKAERRKNRPCLAL